MKKSFPLIIIILLFSSLIIFTLIPQLVFAQPREERALEIRYPEIEGYRPETVKTPVPRYVEYLFKLLIWVSGIVAFAAMVFGGFKYLTSAGNPERLQDAKDQIAAAFLGLLIIFVSYLLLILINPMLVVFHLETLRPILSSLPPGVLLCKESVGVLRAWDLWEEYQYDNPPIERQKEIQKEMDEILKKISEQCYTVLSKGDIRADFDNKVEFVYFIPYIWQVGEMEYETEYGAILYEDRNFGGQTQPMYGHLIAHTGGWEPYAKRVTIEASSIKPFALIYEPDENWEVILYQKTNFNKDFPELEPAHYNCGGDWWCEFDLPWSPESIKIEGDLLVVLYKPPGYGESDSFFAESDYNLLDNENIVTYEWCLRHPIKGCAVAAGRKLAIIAASPY